MQIIHVVCRNQLITPCKTPALGTLGHQQIIILPGAVEGVEDCLRGVERLGFGFHLADAVQESVVRVHRLADARRDGVGHAIRCVEVEMLRLLTVFADVDEVAATVVAVVGDVRAGLGAEQLIVCAIAVAGGLRAVLGEDAVADGVVGELLQICTVFDGCEASQRVVAVLE